MEFIYLCSVFINLRLQNMTKIEQLLNDIQTGNEEMGQKVNYLLRCTLKEREYKIFREMLGIGCRKRGPQEISEELGMTVDGVDRYFKKSVTKLEDLLAKYPDYNIDY